MDIVLNERKKAEYYLRTGYIDRKPTKTIIILIKYFYDKYKDKIVVREQIEQFMKKNYNHYFPNKWVGILDELVDKYASDKFTLQEIDKIEITKSELDYISAINNKRLERVAFVLLVYAKAFNLINPNNTGWVSSDISTILKYAKVNIKKSEQPLVMHQLVQYGAIRITNNVEKTTIFVNYMYPDSEPVITITNFNDTVLEYLKWKGEKIGHCNVCGKAIRINSNCQKYCKECYQTLHREQDRLYQNEKIKNSTNRKSP